MHLGNLIPVHREEEQLGLNDSPSAWRSIVCLSEGRSCNPPASSKTSGSNHWLLNVPANAEQHQYRLGHYVISYVGGLV